MARDIGAVGFREEPAPEQGNPQGAEVLRRRVEHPKVVTDRLAVPANLLLMSFGFNSSRPEPASIPGRRSNVHKWTDVANSCGYDRFVSRHGNRRLCELDNSWTSGDCCREPQVAMGLVTARACMRLAGALAAAGCAWAGLQPVALAQRGPSGADRIVAGLEATSARETLQVASFTTTKTFTIEHDGTTRAHLVAALRFTAPDVKAFAVIGTQGSELLRGRVIDKLMATEIQTTERGRRAQVAISAANYEFPRVAEDGEAFVVEVVPRRPDEFLFKGRIWITKVGFHLARIEGEPARNPSFWTRRIHFVSEYAPVDGVWLLVRTVAHVKVRWFGDYVVRSECGPYRVVLTSAVEADR
jgi:hypothetical protein